MLHTDFYESGCIVVVGVLIRFIVFFFLFYNIFVQRVIPKLFFSPLTSLPIQSKHSKSLFILVQLLLTQHSSQTGTVYWTMRCQVAHSLSHSHKPASALPSVPITMFAKRHLSLSPSLTRRLMTIKINIGSQWSLCLHGCRVTFPLCGECKCVCVSAHVSLSLC